jgi:hypothetical protein
MFRPQRAQDHPVAAQRENREAALVCLAIHPINT